MGDSPAIRDAVGILRQVCARTAGGGKPTILPNGETGTGKGFVAKCVHFNGTTSRDASECASEPPDCPPGEVGFSSSCVCGCKLLGGG